MQASALGWVPAHKAAAAATVTPLRIKCHVRASSRGPVAAQDTTVQQPNQQLPQQHGAAQVPYTFLLPRQAVAMFAAGAALGPFCDGLHSQHNVLHYVKPTVSIQLSSLHWSFETCWWVPLLFGAAGLILGVSVPVLDELVGQRPAGRPGPPSSASLHSSDRQAPTTEAAAAAAAAAGDGGSSPGSSGGVTMGLQPASWSWVMLCISLFVTQYWLSGVLEQPLLGRTLGPVPALDAVLCCYALLHYAVFDATPQGLGMSALTAVCGPVVEVLLIDLGGLYHYTHPVWAGAVPTWIPWVYFCGGPAVGNLGRLVWQTLKQKQQQQRQ